MGFVFITAPKESEEGKEQVNGLNDASVAALNFYNFIKQDTESAPKALRALVSLSNSIPERER